MHVASAVCRILAMGYRRTVLHHPDLYQTTHCDLISLISPGSGVGETKLGKPQVSTPTIGEHPPPVDMHHTLWPALSLQTTSTVAEPGSGIIGPLWSDPTSVIGKKYYLLCRRRPYNQPHVHSGSYQINTGA